MKNLLIILLAISTLGLYSQVIDQRYAPKYNKYRVDYNGFSVNWDSTLRIPNFVYYKLIYDSLYSYGRNVFGCDYSVPKCTEPWEYNYSGYDRGHLMPSASAITYEMWDDCYWMTNITPQLPNLNRKLWKYIEDFERNNSYPYVYIVTGTIVKDTNYIENTDIAIPNYCYKAIYNPSKQKMIGFLVTQNSIGYPYSYAVPIDSIEKVAKINLFYLLPKRLQKSLEKSINYSKWTW